MMLMMFSELHSARKQRWQLGSQPEDWSRGSTFPNTQVILMMTLIIIIITIVMLCHDEKDNDEHPRVTGKQRKEFAK